MKKILYGIMLLFLVGIISLGVIAYRGTTQKGPNYNEAVHEQLEKAIEEGDYETWIKIRQENNLPTKGKIFQVINKDNFNKYVELHNAVQSNDLEKANAIRAELGLGQGQMKRGNTQLTNNQGKMMKGQGINPQGKGQGSQVRQRSFVDANGDGICDNLN
ncbi:MAG: hypothetical protein QXE31_01245 [Candidatus Woesearchaeota archaeon]